jgi:cyclic pyranopterin phosphate synthase
MTSPGPTRETDRRFHMVLGSRCNNNCIFCMEEDREARRRRVEAFSPEDLDAILVENAALGEVMFVSAEPTLSPRFLPLVARARALGYRSVGVISNGRMFAYPAFTLQALEAGLNLVMLSIHGPNARIHDGLTRSPGSFEQAMQGLHNLSTLGRGLVTIRTSTVVCRRNWDPELLLEHARLLGPRVQQMVLNIMQPHGRGLAHIAQLMPPYSELVPRLATFLQGLGPGLPEAYLVDVPYCCTEGAGIPDRQRGFVERYYFYDSRPDQPPQAPQQPRSTLEVQSRDAEDRRNKVHLPTCADCRHRPICDGIWRGYLERFGPDEFRAVPHLPLRNPGCRD